MSGGRGTTSWAFQAKVFNEFFFPASKFVKSSNLKCGGEVEGAHAVRAYLYITSTGRLQ
jgi:hypothetical protein